MINSNKVAMLATSVVLGWLSLAAGAGTGHGELAPAAGFMTAQIMVPHPAAQATAAVYRRAATIKNNNQEGSLVRVLWHLSQGIAAGPVDLVWDGRLDPHSGDGLADDAGLYELRVSVSNVSYTWEGAVGNSGRCPGTNHHSLGAEATPAARAEHCVICSSTPRPRIAMPSALPHLNFIGPIQRAPPRQLLQFTCDHGKNAESGSV